MNWLWLKERESLTRVQILDKAVFISFHTNGLDNVKFVTLFMQVFSYVANRVAQRRQLLEKKEDYLLSCDV